MAAIRAHGPCDNREFFNYWLRADPFYQTLFVSRIEEEPFTGNFADQAVQTMAYLAWVGHWLHTKPGVQLDRVGIRTAYLADMMAIGLPEAMMDTQQGARDKLIDAVTALLRYPNLITFTAFAPADVGELMRQNIEDVMNFVPGPGAVMPRLTVLIAIRVLRAMAASATPAFSLGGIQLIIHVLLATLKKGNMTETFAEKIANGVSQDLSLPNLMIDAQVCAKFYSIYGDGISDVTVPAMVDRWTENVPGHALRIRLTLNQAAGSGLTSLVTIGNAMKAYTDFDWDRVLGIYPDEAGNLLQAARAVGNNKWYGYRKDLGIVKSTNYKALGYVAKELLVKVGGKATLTRYGGWARKVAYQAAVDQLVAQYEARRTAFALGNDVQEEHVNVSNTYLQIMGVIQQGDEVYL